jgi:hypothetical protein
VCKLSNDNRESLKQELEGLKETMAIYLGSLIREVVKEFGERGRGVVKEAARKGGLWQGMKYIRENNIQERGTKAFADFYNSMSDVELFKIKIDEASDKQFVIRTNVCPYIKYWKEMGIPDELPEFCILATYYDLGLAQAFNPNLAIELPEDMIRGDCCCIYIFKEVLDKS